MLLQRVNRIVKKGSRVILGGPKKDTPVPPDPDPEQRAWTPDDMPAMYKSGMSIWEPANATVLPTNQVPFQPDTRGLVNLSQSTSGAQIYKGTRNNYDSWVWPDTNSNRRLISEVSQPGYVYVLMVMQYKTGVEATFTANCGLFRGTASNLDRVIGRINSADLTSSDNQRWTQQVSKNARPASSVILPLPMSMLEFRGVPLQGLFELGYFGGNNGAWHGPGWFCLAMTIEPTGDVLARLQGYVMWRFGLQAQLPELHPWRNEAPWTFVN